MSGAAGFGLVWVGCGGGWLGIGAEGWPVEVEPGEQGRCDCACGVQEHPPEFVSDAFA